MLAGAVNAVQFRRINSKYASTSNTLAVKAITPTVDAPTLTRVAIALRAMDTQYPAMRNKPAAMKGMLAALPG